MNLLFYQLSNDCAIRFVKYLQRLNYSILTSIFYIYYLNGYLKGIPDTFYKAAKIDGASDLEYIWRI